MTFNTLAVSGAHPSRVTPKGTGRKDLPNVGERIVVTQLNGYRFGVLVDRVFAGSDVVGGYQFRLGDGSLMITRKSVRLASSVKGWVKW